MCDGGGDTTSQPGSGDTLDDLAAAVARFQDRPVVALRSSGIGADIDAEGALAGMRLGEDLVRLRHLCDLLEVEFAGLAAAFAVTDEAETQGSVSPVDWIRHHCHMSAAAAASAVCAGEFGTDLVESAMAVTEGRIGYAHLALLASTARALGRADGDGEGFDEIPLLAAALEHSVSRFRFDCAHARHAGDAAGYLADQRDAMARRRLELMPGVGGSVAIRGMLDPVGGATLRTALEPLARPGGALDDRDRARRLADALVELANHSLDSSNLPGRTGGRSHLQVTVSLDTLQGLRGASGGELEFAPPVPTATVQRLACDAAVTRIVLDPASQIVDVGRALRVPSPSTRRALVARDGGCVWPRCDRGAAWTTAHHVLHWGHGGRTAPPNLVLLCYRHHEMVHEGGWQLARTSDHLVLAVPPRAGFRRARARAPHRTEVGSDTADEAARSVRGSWRRTVVEKALAPHEVHDDGHVDQKRERLEQRE